VKIKFLVNGVARLFCPMDDGGKIEINLGLTIKRYFSDRMAGLPDGLFSNPKSQFGFILDGLGMENVFIFYDH
jgi:hypothetical protein